MGVALWMPHSRHPQTGCHPYFRVPHPAQWRERPDLSPARPCLKVGIVYQALAVPSLELLVRGNLQEGETWQLPLHGKPQVPGDEEPPRNPRLVDSESPRGWNQGTWLAEVKARAESHLVEGWLEMLSSGRSGWTGSRALFSQLV